MEIVDDQNRKIGEHPIQRARQSRSKRVGFFSLGGQSAQRGRRGFPLLDGELKRRQNIFAERGGVSIGFFQLQPGDGEIRRPGKLAGESGLSVAGGGA